MAVAKGLTSGNVARVERNSGDGNPLGIKLPLELLCPKDDGEFRKAIASYLWPRIIFAFEIEIIDGTEIDSRREEPMCSRRNLGAGSGLHTRSNSRLTYIYNSDVRIGLLCCCDQQWEKGLREGERAQVTGTILNMA